MDHEMKVRIKEFERLMGRDWVKHSTGQLEERIRRPKKLPEVDVDDHPIASLFHRVLPRLGQREGPNQDDLVRLGALAEDVIRPVEHGSVGADERIARLRSTDHEDVRATLYEFGVATMLIRRDHSVDFLPERPDKGIKTPDLLVDGCVEVECKRRGKTQQEKADRELWELFHRKVIRLIQAKCEVSMVIELYSDEVPTRGAVDWALSVVRSHVESGSIRAVEQVTDGHRVVIRKVRLHLDHAGLSCDPQPADGPRHFEKADIMMKVQDQKRIDGSGLFMMVRAGAGVRVARSLGLPNLLDTARKQFSGERPAVVFVDLQLPILDSSERDHGPANQAVQDWMRQHRSIAAAVITTDVFKAPGGGSVAVRLRSKNLAECPRLPLPDDFAL